VHSTLQVEHHTHVGHEEHCDGPEHRWAERA
jgi:hypothetical protein